MSTDEDMLTVPLPAEKIQEVIANTDATYFIDYKNSRIKGKPFIFYLSNLNVQTRLNLEGVTVDELEELLLAYIEVTVLFKCDELNVLFFTALLDFIGVEHSDIPNFHVPDGFYEQFIANHQEVLSRHFVFLSSMIKYCDFVQDEATGDNHDLSEYDGVIDHGKFVGVNVAWLFSIPCFFELFFSADVEYPQYFFPVQFGEFIFNGQKLVSFFVLDDVPNWLLAQRLESEDEDDSHDSSRTDQ